MTKHFWRDLLLLFSGVVVGSLVAKLTSGISQLSWLSYGLFFGTSSPFNLKLGVIDLTFGISINITISVIIFTTVIYLVGRKLIKF